MREPVQRFVIHVHSFGSCWWLDRHAQIKPSAMDIINTTAICSGRRKRHLWTQAGFMRARLSMLRSYAHQNDMRSQTFRACLLLKQDGIPTLRFERREKGNRVGDKLLLCTHSQEYGMVDAGRNEDNPALFLLSAAGTKGEREHLWICSDNAVIHFMDYRLRTVATDYGWRLVREVRTDDE